MDAYFLLIVVVLAPAWFPLIRVLQKPESELAVFLYVLSIVWTGGGFLFLQSSRAASGISFLFLVMIGVPLLLAAMSADGKSRGPKR